MRLEDIGERGHNHSVAYSIKCTILEILCAFSQLNMDERVYKGLENTKDYQLLFENSRYEKEHQLHCLKDYTLMSVSLGVIPSIALLSWMTTSNIQQCLLW